MRPSLALPLVFALTGCLAPSAEVGPPDIRMPYMVVQPVGLTEAPPEEVVLPIPLDRSLVRGVAVADVTIAPSVNAVLPVEAEPINEAMLNTLAAHGLLNVGRPRYRLNVRLATLTLPNTLLQFNPLEFSVRTEMGYEMIDIPTKSTVWRADLTTDGTLSGLDIDRQNAARDATEQAVQENIRQMLGQLYQKQATFQMVEPQAAPVPQPPPIPMIPPINMSGGPV